MTMEIQITNKDSARTATIEVQDFDIGRRTIACVDKIALAPGEQRSVYIHAARQIVVQENPMAAQPTPNTP